MYGCKFIVTKIGIKVYSGHQIERKSPNRIASGPQHTAFRALTKLKLKVPWNDQFRQIGLSFSKVQIKRMLLNVHSFHIVLLNSKHIRH